MAALAAVEPVTETLPMMHQNGSVHHRESPETGVCASVLRLHLYHSSQQGAARSVLTYPPGDYVAEELCVEAAEACGISPLYCSLFALYRHTDAVWLPPSHVFQLDHSSSEDVFFRLRFYFPGWYSGGASGAYRYGVTKGSESPVLDDAVMMYLFSQWRSDFLDGVVQIPSSHEAQEECLGLAVLDMTRTAKERHVSPLDVYHTSSYKSFLPKPLSAHIQNCSFLTRKRIRFRFKSFMQQFSQCHTTARDLRLKYLISMEALDRGFYTETFQVQEPSRGPLVLLVAADTGVQWCGGGWSHSEQV